LKAKIAETLVDFYFVWEKIAASGTELPMVRTPLGKVLLDFSSTLVRVRNFVANELANEEETRRAIKSIVLSGE